MTVRSPTLADVLNTLREGIFRDLRVSCVARVLQYDAQALEVEVQPIPADTYEDETGTRQSLPLPAITGVPLHGLEAGGFHIRVTPVPGDFVTLVFSDRSLDAFLASRTESAPIDGRRHALADAVAYPLFGPSRPGSLPACVSLGANTGSDDFVALASKVLTELNKLKTAFNMHVHVETGTTTNAPTPVPTIIPVSIDSVASASVSVRG